MNPASFNLLHEPWLPVQRRDGRREWIAPARITDDLSGNPVVASDWPRADFRMATMEFLIGLLTTACPPADEDEWLDRWRRPPAPEVLAAAFAPLEPAFNLDGDGPRFMQDFDATLPDTGNAIEQLLIEAPGEQGVTDNKTLFVKAGRVERLSRAAAAIALYTLQTYAPAGGRGNLTSVRGGGPLTTLVLPGGDLSLWYTLWANVPQGKRATAHELSRVFPWLAPTRTADRHPTTLPADAHPLQAFWGLPRRIRLAFSDNPTQHPCDLTGLADAIQVIGWGQRPNGVKYVAWDHPLSPSYKNGKDETGGWLPVHPQPEGIGYRHWAALVAGDSAGTRRPAPIIVAWQNRQHDVPTDAREARLLAAGYDTDNMKARGFVESEMPLPGNADPATTRAMAFLAQHLITAAETVAQALRSAVRAARYRPGTAATGSASLATVYEALWTATRDDFFQALREVAQPTDAPADHALKHTAPHWLRRLNSVAFTLFDEAAPLDLSVTSFDPARIVKARRQLWFTLNGYGPAGKKLFTTLLMPAKSAKQKPPPSH
jgi:CRISPR system Cascade subunit CasA